MKKILFSFILLSSLLFTACEKDTVETNGSLEHLVQPVLDSLQSEIELPNLIAGEAFFKHLPADLQHHTFSQNDLSGNTTAENLLQPKANDLNPRSNGVYYNIQFSGNTFGGYYPFNRNGCMILAPRIPGAGNVNLNNGANIVEVALFSGTPFSTDRGAVWYGTNTAMCQYGNTGCSTYDSALDVAYTQWYPEYRALVVEVDGRFYNNSAAGNSILNMLNIFNATGSFTSQSYRIISGYMVIYFSEDWSRTGGEILFYGSSMNGYAPVEYRAQFGGYSIAYCNQ